MLEIFSCRMSNYNKRSRSFCCAGHINKKNSPQAFQLRKQKNRQAGRQATKANRTSFNHSGWGGIKGCFGGQIKGFKRNPTLIHLKNGPMPKAHTPVETTPRLLLTQTLATLSSHSLLCVCMCMLWKHYTCSRLKESKHSLWSLWKSYTLN